MSGVAYTPCYPSKNRLEGLGGWQVAAGGGKWWSGRIVHRNSLRVGVVRKH